MPIDLRNLGQGAQTFLKQFLPYLAQQAQQRKMVEFQADTWLQKTLKEYSAYGDIQSKQQNAALMNAIFGDLSDVMKDAVKGKPFPGQEFIQRGKQFGLPMGDLALPPEAEQAAAGDQYKAAALPLIMARMTKKQPSEEDVTAALSVFGFEAVESLIGDFAGDVLKRAEQDLRRGELGVSQALVPIRKGEAATSAARVSIEKKGGQTAKEIQAEVKKLSNDRDTQVQKLTGIGSPTGIIFDNQARVISAKIGKLDKRLREIEQLTGRQILPSEEDYATFEKMATENVAEGREIDWEAALILMFDIYWIRSLQKKLGIGDSYWEQKRKKK